MTLSINKCLTNRVWNICIGDVLAGIKDTVWDKDPHTDAKHQILEEYLKAWFPILTRWNGKIIYIDGFAGPGVYSKGEDGSPIIAIKTAQNHSQSSTFNEILFLFIEKDKERVKNLQEVIAKKFPSLPHKFKCIIKGDEFAPTLEKFLDDVDSSGDRLSPTLAFIDPFGYSGMPMTLIARLLANSKTEVIITFMTGFIVRFTDEMRAEALDELFGTNEWRKVNQIKEFEEREKFLIDLYTKQLREAAGATYVRTFEMRDSANRPLYHLVFGTKNLKGMEVMKAAMFKVDRRGTYKFSDKTDRAILPHRLH